MAITYTWEVTSINTRNENDFENAIVQTHWKKIGTDEEGNTGYFSGATPFTTEGMDPDNFVPFSELTEETVLGWIQAVVVDSYEEHVNGRILEAINDAKNPINQNTALPWAPVSGSGE